MKSPLARGLIGRKRATRRGANPRRGKILRDPQGRVTSEAGSLVAQESSQTASPLGVRRRHRRGRGRGGERWPSRWPFSCAFALAYLLLSAGSTPDPTRSPPDGGARSTCCPPASSARGWRCARSTGWSPPRARRCRPPYDQFRNGRGAARTEFGVGFSTVEPFAQAPPGGAAGGASPSPGRPRPRPADAVPKPRPSFSRTRARAAPLDHTSIRALHFPRTAEDDAGFDALRSRAPPTPPTGGSQARAGTC